MTTQEAINYFGTQRALAEAIGLWPHAIYRPAWHPCPPPLRQFQIQVLSGDVLKADPALLRTRQDA